MRLHRFIGNFDLNQKQIVINDADFINQTRNVLRLKVGDELILCDGKTNEAKARFTELGSGTSKLEISGVYKNENEARNYVHLYCPILKKENFELAVQKAVEIGIKEITPIITTRTVKLGLNYERLNKIIKEASEQSGRGVLPKLNETIDFDKAAETAKSNNDLNLFFNIDASPLGSLASKWIKVGVFVGPEGGWTEEEIKIAQSAGFTFVGLGKTILRAETGVIISSYLACGL